MCSAIGRCGPVVWVFSTSGFHRFFVTKPVSSETSKAERWSIWRPWFYLPFAFFSSPRGVAYAPPLFSPCWLGLANRPGRLSSEVSLSTFNCRSKIPTLSGLSTPPRSSSTRHGARFTDHNSPVTSTVFCTSLLRCFVTSLLHSFQKRQRPPAAMGAAAKRAYRLQERRSCRAFYARQKQRR
jgi:hypothetical protein